MKTQKPDFETLACGNPSVGIRKFRTPGIDKNLEYNDGPAGGALGYEVTCKNTGKPLLRWYPSTETKVLELDVSSIPVGQREAAVAFVRESFASIAANLTFELVADFDNHPRRGIKAGQVYGTAPASAPLVRLATA